MLIHPPKALALLVQSLRTIAIFCLLTLWFCRDSGFNLVASFRVAGFTAIGARVLVLPIHATTLQLRLNWLLLPVACTTAQSCFQEMRKVSLWLLSASWVLWTELHLLSHLCLSSYSCPLLYWLPHAPSRRAKYHKGPRNSTFRWNFYIS
jgi:hypothetical protein